MKKSFIKIMLIVGIIYCSLFFVTKPVSAMETIKLGKTKDFSVISNQEKIYKLKLKSKAKLSIFVSAYNEEPYNLDSGNELIIKVNKKFKNGSQRTLGSKTFQYYNLNNGADKRLIIKKMSKGTYYISAHYKSDQDDNKKVGCRLDLSYFEKYTKKIRFQDKKVKLYKGDKASSYTYAKYGIIDGKVKYKSSNKKIATVNKKGFIKGKGIGKCYIYAWVKGGKKAKCKVTVIKKPPMTSPKKVTLKNYNKLKYGMTYKQVIKILGLPNSILYSMSNDGETDTCYKWDANGILMYVHISSKDGVYSLSYYN